MATIPCEAATGGLVIGHVTDTSTSAGLAGAIVTGALPTNQATTIVEPLNPANGNGIFVLFSSTGGAVDVTATDADHVAKTQSIDVRTGGIASLDFTLAPASPPTITQVLPAAIAASGGTSARDHRHGIRERSHDRDDSRGGGHGRRGDRHRVAVVHPRCWRRRVHMMTS